MDRLFTAIANRIATAAGQPITFAVAFGLILVWSMTGPIFGYSDTWQLIINTLTTIVTFLLVALLQNAQYRSDEATQHKLNAIADALADLMIQMHERTEDSHLKKDVAELRAAVGLEQRESTSNNEADDPTGGDQDASGPRGDAARPDRSQRGDGRSPDDDHRRDRGGSRVS